MNTRAALLAVLAGGALFPAAANAALAPAAAPAAFAPRPHASFELRDAGVRVARFDVHAQPRGDRVLVSVTMTARSRATDVRAVLRIGRCTGGPVATPSCEPDISRDVLLHPRRTTIVGLSARVRAPSASRDAIRVSLTPPGRVVRPSSPRVAIVDMLLPASAWTRSAGQGFGLRVARPWEGDLLPYDVTTIAVRGSQVDAGRLDATLAWTARLPAGTLVSTTAGQCQATDAGCPPVSETAADARGIANSERRQPLPRVRSRQMLTYGARTSEGPLFDLVMPWPR